MGKIYKRKTGKCKCHQCNIEFEKPLSEIKRNEKFGRYNFCCRSCVGHFNTEKLLNNRVNYDISKHSDNIKDEYTGLRDFIRRIKSRNYQHDIDLPYLKELWLTGNVCIYTGVELNLPKRKGENSQLYTASLDRIDSNLGYMKGNIRFISIAANHAKNNMSHEDMVNFCNLIFNHKKTSSEDEV
jgi:hypothetical protein